MRGRLFEAIIAGRAPQPECAKTLGVEILGYDLDALSIEVMFEGRPEFANPIGTVQGGFLSAMLDDCMGLVSTTTLDIGQFAPTLNLAVQFHRPAKIGKLKGIGRIVTRGTDILHLAGELFQRDRLIASATATATIRKARPAR